MCSLLVLLRLVFNAANDVAHLISIERMTRLVNDTKVGGCTDKDTCCTRETVESSGFISFIFDSYGIKHDDPDLPRLPLLGERLRPAPLERGRDTFNREVPSLELRGKGKCEKEGRSELMKLEERHSVRYPCGKKPLVHGTKR